MLIIIVIEAIRALEGLGAAARISFSPSLLGELLPDSEVCDEELITSLAFP